MRERIYEIVSEAYEDDFWSKLYDVFMIMTIVASLAPLCFKTYSPAMRIIDIVTVTIFIIDYILRLMTADFKFHKKSAVPFLLYPLTPMAIVDMLAILPTVIHISSGFKLLKLLKLLKFARVIKALTFLRHSRYVGIIENVFKRQKGALICVLAIAILYISASALVVFNSEPDAFDTFFDAIYFSTMSITTLSQNEVQLVTTIGKFVNIISSIIGIVIVALPAAILTAGYINELKETVTDKN
ncbi:MAG: ion transporter [Oscillospiraceae bacterium]|nr:ion transporter [Oscillospiraceae bacterium]